jgi:hypothetical protein
MAFLSLGKLEQDIDRTCSEIAERFFSSNGGVKAIY